jgi:subtilisin family serine protease
MSRHTFIRVLMWCSLVAVFGAGSARAAWLWDTNNDKIDDRIAQVESGGALAARVGGLASGKLRFALVNAAAPFRYGVYIGYDHHPTDADALALQAYGVTPLVRYQSIDYIRAELTAAQAVQVAALTGITRIETIPLLYAVNDVASRALRARESDAMFPSVWSNLGYTGRGVSVAILDTGVNDEADATTGYPGHESLRGKFLGGGNFFAGQPLLNTPLESSENPKHILDPEATYHGTHVAGTAIGSGGPNGMLAGATPGTYAGVAPDARLIDCKVLSDAGVGFGAADALDWLIHHRSDYWGLTGADTIYRGVDVATPRAARSTLRCAPASRWWLRPETTAMPVGSRRRAPPTWRSASARSPTTTPSGVPTTTSPTTATKVRACRMATASSSTR